MKTVSIPTSPNPYRIIITREVLNNTYLLIIYLLTHTLTAWDRGLLGKLTSCLVKKFPAYCIKLY